MSDHYFPDDWSEHEESGYLVSGDYWILSPGDDYELAINTHWDGIKELSRHKTIDEAKQAATAYVGAYNG